MLVLPQNQSNARGSMNIMATLAPCITLQPGGLKIGCLLSVTARRMSSVLAMPRRNVKSGYVYDSFKTRKAN